MRRRVAEARVGRLATVGARRCSRTSFRAASRSDGDTVYSAVDGKPKSTRALRRLDNIRANPRATLLVDFYDDDWEQLWWVRLDATGRVSDRDSDPGAEFDLAVELLRDKYEQYRRGAADRSGRRARYRAVARLAVAFAEARPTRGRRAQQRRERHPERGREHRHDEAEHQHR